LCLEYSNMAFAEMMQYLRWSLRKERNYMQTTFSGFESARQALMAAQTALSITSQNIANASTTGYTRQRIVLTSTGPDTGTNKYMVNQAGVGQGVTVSSVQQVRDNFLDVRYRSENSSKSMWGDLSSSLSQVEDITNEFSSDDSLTGLSGQLSTLASNLKQWQTTPNDSNMAATIKNSIASICQTLNSDNSQLTQLSTQLKGSLQITVDGTSAAGTTGDGGMNATLKSISSLNQQIAVYEVSGQTANELRDQRNTLLDDLSSNADINVTTQDNGMVTVALKNDSTHMLIDSNNVVSELQMNATQTKVQWQGSPPTDAVVTGGSIGASLQVINGDGTNSGTNGELGIPAMQNKLNAFATGFMAAINGVAPTGTALLKGTDASNIAISDAWGSNTALITQNNTSSDASTYAAKFISALNQKGTAVAGYSGTFQDYTDSISLDVANRLSYVKQMSSSSNSIVSNLDSQRKSVSAVSIDEEGVNMIKYQQSYNAAARVMTVMSEMLDTLIKSF
jgi:flagellar hook-associated protein 1 FlgK